MFISTAQRPKPCMRTLLHNSPVRTPGAMSEWASLIPAKEMFRCGSSAWSISVKGEHSTLFRKLYNDDVLPRLALIAWKVIHSQSRQDPRKVVVSFSLDR